MKEQISFEEFLLIEKKLDIRIGQIISCDRIPKSKKLLELLVIFGPSKEDQRKVVTNLGDKLEPWQLIGVWCPFIMNLTPVTMMGVESQAMIMVGERADGSIELDKYSMGSKLL